MRDLQLFWLSTIRCMVQYYPLADDRDPCDTRVVNILSDIRF